jgi:hypothetical protein
MIKEAFISFSEETYAAVVKHLVPGKFLIEELAFVYARAEIVADVITFNCVEWLPVPPEGFAHRSEYYIELSDETKAAAIKRAHDLGASLVEFHSHTGSWPAKFSPSDISGFEEFVPHVWWRLKGRPYAAAVVTRSGFDGFAWITSKDSPQRLDGILVEKQLIRPTGLSPLPGDLYDYRTI